MCSECEVGLWEEDQICPVCGWASRYGLKHKYCRQPYSLDGLTCLWAYEGVARKIISKAKYRFYYDMLSELLRGSKSLGMPAVGAQVPLDACPVVVPVPLYSKREKWRGFNQAEMIGRWLAEKENLESRNLLVRVKNTGQQVGKLRRERLENIKNAFQLGLGYQVSDRLVINGVYHYGTSSGSTRGQLLSPMAVTTDNPYGAIPGSSVSYSMTTSLAMIGINYTLK